MVLERDENLSDQLKISPKGILIPNYWKAQKDRKKTEREEKAKKKTRKKETEREEYFEVKK